MRYENTTFPGPNCNFEQERQYIISAEIRFRYINLYTDPEIPPKVTQINAEYGDCGKNNFVTHLSESYYFSKSMNSYSFQEL
jgi:hypothetical protein